MSRPFPRPPPEGPCLHILHAHVPSAACAPARLAAGFVNSGDGPAGSFPVTECVGCGHTPGGAQTMAVGAQATWAVEEGRK